MPCAHVHLPGGGSAIVCSETHRCACGRRATLQCDWKVPAKKSGTCDRYICDRCSTSPATDKDLCPEHAEAWQEWKATHGARKSA